jgi:hypothetical protein
MLASELIAKLQATVEEHGDMLVAVRIRHDEWEPVAVVSRGVADKYVRGDGWSFGVPALRLDVD